MHESRNPLHPTRFLSETKSWSCVSSEDKTHLGMLFSSQRTNVPPRVLSFSLEVQGLFQGLMLGPLLTVCLSEPGAASPGKENTACTGQAFESYITASSGDKRQKNICLPLI